MASLRTLFERIAWKRLAAVDLPHGGSNQHEINGARRLREFFDDQRIEGAIEWHYFDDDGTVESEGGLVTFYDSRENQPKRSAEWRLYYRGEFLRRAQVGDLLVLLRDSEQKLYGLIFPISSGLDFAAATLFGLGLDQTQIFSHITVSEKELTFAQRRIAEAIGLDVEPNLTAEVEESANRLLQIAKAQGLNFPPTEAMAVAARQLMMVDLEDPDVALVTWLDTEERLFYAVERLVLDPTIVSGFRTVEEFLTLAKSVTNRRKSRMGRSLEKHLATIFRAHRLYFDEQASTEGKNKPDFLFPGAKEYHDVSFPVSSLAMLAAKSTAKDRWRQVLTEAQRIERKHLFTLEPAISTDQTTEMGQYRVQLVVPAAIRQTYTEIQRARIQNLADFIGEIRDQQS